MLLNLCIILKPEKNKMKKIIVLLITLLCMCACEYNAPSGEYKYIVEEKYETLGGSYAMWISDINTHRQQRIEVGKYTFETYNPGDTLVFKFNYDTVEN